MATYEPGTLVIHVTGGPVMAVVPLPIEAQAILNQNTAGGEGIHTRWMDKQHKERTGTFHPSELKPAPTEPEKKVVGVSSRARGMRL